MAAMPLSKTTNGDRAAGIPVPLAFHVKPISTVDGKFLPIIDSGSTVGRHCHVKRHSHRDSSDNRLYAKGDCPTSLPAS